MYLGIVTLEDCKKLNTIDSQLILTTFMQHHRHRTQRLYSCLGFNTSLFAYGQTGAGKSYSMVGYGVNKGIVPITCDEMFKSIESNADTNKVSENGKFSLIRLQYKAKQ